MDFAHWCRLLIRSYWRLAATSGTLYFFGILAAYLAGALPSSRPFGVTVLGLLLMGGAFGLIMGAMVQSYFWVDALLARRRARGS